MTGQPKNAASEAAGAVGLGLLAAVCCLAGWGLLAAAGVAALVPVMGTALTLALVAAFHLLVALMAALRVRAILREAAERRRARMVNFALLRSALMLMPGRRRPAARQGVAAVLAVIALALFLAPSGRTRTETGGDDPGEKPEAE